MVKIGDFAHDIGFKILGRRVTAGRPSQPGYPSGPRRGIERFDRSSMDYKRSQTFGFEIKGLDIGDVDGDKKNEVVIMDYHNLYVFKYNGEKLVLFQKIETGDHYNFLTVDVADVNRNGVAEIIVTAVVEDDVRSLILEYEQGKFRKITEKSNWFLRVLNLPKEGSTLMGQRRGSEGLPVGPIYKFVWQKKSFEKGPKMPFPSETNIFGLAYSGIREKDKLDVITVDELERLRIVSPDGKDLWTHKDNFGGTANYYDTTKKKDMVYSYANSPPWRVYIPARIITKELDGQGLYEVILNKNGTSGTRLFDKARSFDRGEIYGLVWEENTLETIWKTRQLDGYIADFQLKDADNDGEEELVVAVVFPNEAGDKGAFDSKKPRSNILFFTLF
jgi:hypothetical protein